MRASIIYVESVMLKISKNKLNSNVEKEITKNHKEEPNWNKKLNMIEEDTILNLTTMNYIYSLTGLKTH